MMGERTFMMVNGPSHFGANFGLMICRFRLRASIHTLSPFLNRVKCLQDLAAMVCRASSCAVSASS